MLFQVIANQFIVIKKTWPNVIILSIGVLVNVFLNMVLIPIFGIEGAAIATLTGYAVSDVICTIVLCRMKLMIISKRFLAMTVGMLIFILIWRFYVKENAY